MSRVDTSKLSQAANKRVTASMDAKAYLNEIDEIVGYLEEAYTNLVLLNNKFNSETYYCGDALYDIKVFYTKMQEYVFQLINFYLLAKVYANNAIDELLLFDVSVAGTYNLSGYEE